MTTKAEWEERFEAATPFFKEDQPELWQATVDYFRRAIEIARQEGRHAGMIEAGKLVDEINDHTK